MVKNVPCVALYSTHSDRLLLSPLSVALLIARGLVTCARLTSAVFDQLTALSIVLLPRAAAAAAHDSIRLYHVLLPVNTPEILWFMRTSVFIDGFLVKHHVKWKRGLVLTLPALIKTCLQCLRYRPQEGVLCTRTQLAYTYECTFLPTYKLNYLTNFVQRLSLDPICNQECLRL